MQACLQLTVFDRQFEGYQIPKLRYLLSPVPSIAAQTARLVFIPSMQTELLSPVSSRVTNTSDCQSNTTQTDLGQQKQPLWGP